MSGHHLGYENAHSEEAFCGADSSTEDRVSMGYYFEQRKNGLEDGRSAISGLLIGRTRAHGPSVRSRLPVQLALFALACLLLALAGQMIVTSAQGYGPITASYPENHDSPVIALTSTDPEGMGVHWDITGLDAEAFSISPEGVITFRHPPDYEAPTDKGRDNEYHLVVHAIEVREEGATRRALSSSRDVVVLVRNVDERGTVVLNRLQPEVGTPLTAVLTDGAGIDGDVSWRWYTSKVIDPDPSYDSHWSVVGGADNGTYTPRGDRVDGVVSESEDPGAPVDEGRFLRVIADYTDQNGSMNRAVGMSVHPVRAEVSSDLDVDVGFPGNPANGSPGFSPHLDYSFSVVENSPVGTPVGEPVVALDPNHDILTYELDDTRSPDDQVDRSGGVGAFSVDMATGQIEVAVEALSYEDRPGVPYRFFVRAIDPSGETAEVEVSVSLTDLNDPPVFGEVTTGGLPPTTLRTDEQSDDVPDSHGVEGALHVFSATDEDLRGQVSVRLEGEDRSAFKLADVIVDGQGGLRALLFDNPPDHEEPADRYGSNIYRVTLVATDSEGAETRLPVTVLVDNVPEGGGVTMSAEGLGPEQPKVGEWVHAELADPDGEVAAVTWQWSRGDSHVEGTRLEIIPGATGRSYMPTEDDSGHYLQVTATYIDSTSEPDDPRTTKIDERVQKLEGTTVTAKTAGDSDAADRLYRVTSTTVYSVLSEETGDDDGTPTGFDRSSNDREVAENSETGTIVGAPVRVLNHSDEMKYEFEDQFPRDHFTIDRHGQIRVGAVPVPAGTTYAPHVSPVATTTDPGLDHEGTGPYVLTVRATDSGNDVSVTRVNVTVRDVNEPPYFTSKTREELSSPIIYPERTRDLTVAMLSAVEPDGDEFRWGLNGSDASSFTIEAGRLAFRERRDFEMPGSAAGTNTYDLKVTVTELAAVGGGPLRSADLPVTVEVTDRNDPGSVDFSLLQPEVGSALTVSLRDFDGSVSGTEWAWYIARVSIPGPVTGTGPSDLAAEWSRITGTAGETYTPVAANEGRYMLAVATYADAHGTGSVAHAMTPHPVRPDVSDDANNAPGFSGAELTITVPESLTVGDPVGQPVVVAMNADNEVLTYDLDDDFDRETDPDMRGDIGFFTINRSTGQLYLRRELSHEPTDDRDYEDADSPIEAGTYTVVVRATDPSGEADGGDSDTVVVRVVATDVNDAPRFESGMSELSVYEADSSREATDSTRYEGLGYVLEEGATAPTLDPGSPNVYRVTDDDAVEAHTWPTPIAGPDGALFEYSIAGSAYGRRLHFRSPPDYENPKDADGDNVYQLTVRAVDRSGAAAEKNVRVRVLNVNETGSLSITPTQPVAGSPVVATLTDPDGIVTVTKWLWATSSDSISEFPGGNVVEGASTASYTGMAGEFLGVMVKYRDGASIEDDPGTVFDERNDDPDTPSEVTIETGFDSDEVLSAVTRYAVQSPNPSDPDSTPGHPAASPVAIDMEVAENTPGTGYAGLPVNGLGIRKTTGGLADGMFVFAEDHDARGEGYYDDALAPAQDMDDKVDQLALKPGVHLDFESTDGYVLELPMAGGDPDEAVFILNVTVTDVNEPPSIPERTGGLSPPVRDDTGGPVFVTSTTTRYVAENTPAGEDIGHPVIATHPGQEEVLSYSLVGVDGSFFDISTTTGQVLTSEPLDHETRTRYVVEVLASDATGSTATVTVSIFVTNVGLDTRYDVNDSGTIEREEVMQAVRDFFSGDPGIAPTREEILELVSLYLSG